MVVRARWQARWSALLCAVLSACSPAPFVAAPMDADAPAIDGATLADDVLDASMAIDGAVDDAFDSATADAGCEVACPADPCVDYEGCDCVPVPREEGASCGRHGETCGGGTCNRPPPGCGTGWRDIEPVREGCDDGNLIDGDACSSTCTPTAFALSAPDAESFGLAMAVDGMGSMLFAWVETAEGPSKPTLSLRAATYTGMGVLENGPFELEAGIGVGQAVTPTVAGLASGWAVAWRSTSIEGVGRDQGGIAFAVLSHAGALRHAGQVNVDERFDQSDPAAAPFGEGFAVAWTDGSDRPDDPGLGVRVRVFDDAGAPVGDLATAATVTVGDQAEAALAGNIGSTDLAATFTDRSEGEPVTMLRRVFTTDPDPAPVAATYAWSASPAIDLFPDGTVWLAWTDRSADPTGDAYALRVAPGTSPDVGTPVGFGTDRLETDVVIVAYVATKAVLGWRTTATPAGLRIAGVNYDLAPEAASLALLLRGGRERALSMASTEDGLWLGWIDESSGEAAVMAYLLPWE